ncbi:MAG: TlpA disulfide reductase family protein [Sphaerobacter sp.]|nr:TlpA disulfide reductase family protein [Sphaerobacter sp.]
MEQPPDSSLRNRIIPALVVVVIVALLSLFGLSLWSPGSTSSLGAGGRINEVGQLVRFDDGRTAPTFSLRTFDGQQISLDQFQGKTVVINFWGSWCPPCQEEAPILEEFSRNLDPDVVIIGIDVWDRQEDAAAFIKQHGLTFPNGIDEDGAITIDYGVSGIPETFVIAPDGRLLGKYSGPVESVEQLRGMIRDLMGAG